MPNLQVVEIRFVISNELPVDKLIHEIGYNLEDVYAAAELKNNGFGHMLPMGHRETFVNTVWDPGSEISRMIEEGK